MNVRIGNESSQFHFLKYVNQIFGTVWYYFSLIYGWVADAEEEMQVKTQIPNPSYCHGW
jgi:hypothetical protein